MREIDSLLTGETIELKLWSAMEPSVCVERGCPLVEVAVENGYWIKWVDGEGVQREKASVEGNCFPIGVDSVWN